MDIFFEQFFDRLESTHNEISEVINGKTVEFLDWKPAEDIPSINVFVIHLIGAQRYWIGDVIAGEPSYRDRDAEFKVSGLTSETLQINLNESLDYVKHVLNKISLEDLDAQRTSPRDGKIVTVSWSLLHVLKHSANHLGHIQIIKQLAEQEY